MEGTKSLAASAPRPLSNSALVGRLTGCCSLLGRATRAMRGLIGEHAGTEILKYAHAQGLTIDSLKSVEAFVRDTGLAGGIFPMQEDGEIRLTIVSGRDYKGGKKRSGGLMLPGGLYQLSKTAENSDEVLLSM